MVPVIETERLILRAHNNSDFQAVVKMWNEEIVYRNTIGKPSTEQQTWSRMSQYLGQWALNGFGYWAVEEKSSGRFVGDMGFADFKRELNPSITGLPEMGWAFASEFHGKGLASEALSAALSWGDKNLKSKRIAAIINPDNLRSMKLAEKYGFKFAQEAVFAGSTVRLFFRG